jgi:hypothetical protein
MNEREFATPKMLMGGFVVVVLVVFLPPHIYKKNRQLHSVYTVCPSTSCGRNCLECISLGGSSAL